jgi:hypothetical protein
MQSRTPFHESPALSVHVEGTHFGAEYGIPTGFHYDHIHRLFFTNGMADHVLMMMSSPAAPAINKLDLVVDRYSDLNGVCANVRARSLKLEQKDLNNFSFFSALPRSLEKLDISISFYNYEDSSKISTDDFVSAVSQNLQNLKKIKCNGLSSWNQAQIGALFQNLTQLQQLEATGTFQLATEGQEFASGEGGYVRFVRDASSGRFTLAQWAKVSSLLTFPSATVGERQKVAGGLENYVDQAARFYGVSQTLPTLRKMSFVTKLSLWDSDSTMAAELLRSLPMLSVFTCMSLKNENSLDWLQHPMLRNLSISDADLKAAGVTSLKASKPNLPNLSRLKFRATCRRTGGLSVEIDGLDDLLEVEIEMETRVQCSLVLRGLPALRSVAVEKINIPSLIVENCAALVKFEVISCKVPANFNVPASLPQLAKEEFAKCKKY